MVASLAHRGPDGHGQVTLRGCILGHRRLAIVDIADGAQPMLSAHRPLAVTFNGEIYGYREIRDSLAGYAFRTHSDTEVILALYEKYGSAAVDRIPGMFAFAIWDEHRQELFCARDRFGEKPFYYALGRKGEFLFASEIKGLLASGLIDPVLDREAVARYLQRQCVRPDQSIYKNVGVLPPAHCLTYRQGKVEIRRYWSAPDIQSDIDLADASERMAALLKDAVRRQLVADVPVGAFLSGGLDSSTICLVARELASELRTFSFDFEGSHSEVEFARQVARQYGTNHTELKSSGTEIGKHMLQLQEVYDEPFADSAVIPSYLLAREARRHLKVVLTGDGGDEFLGGYAWYKPLLWMQREGRVGLLRWTAERLVNRAAALLKLPGAAAREYRIMGMSFGRRYASALEAHKAQLCILDRQDIEGLGLPLPESDADSRPGGTHGSIDDAIRLDISDYLPANNLTKIDRASMAHGLELRAPFLDVELASFCMSLPYRLKVSTREDKIILRHAFAARWPAALRRRSKQGFGAPLTRWLQDPAILELESIHLRSRRAALYDLIPYSGVERLLARNDCMARWTLLILAIWVASRKAGGEIGNLAETEHVPGSQDVAVSAE